MQQNLISVPVNGINVEISGRILFVGKRKKGETGILLKKFEHVNGTWAKILWHDNEIEWYPIGGLKRT